MPAELVAALAALPGPAGGKRERTRAQLLNAAVQVFSARGVALGTLQEIASVAGVANGTVHHHFASKDELVLQLATSMAEGLCRAIQDSSAHVREGAERMAIGNRRYLWLAQASPAWAMVLLEVAMAAPDAFTNVRKYPLADLRLGVRQKSFRVASEAAAMDMIAGTVTQAMRSIALGGAPAGHAEAVATTVLGGLGVPAAQAQEIARRPLPPFRPAA